MFPHSLFTLHEKFLFMAVYQAWDFQRGRIREVSNLASLKFLPLSCMKGKELGNGTPIHKLGTCSLPVMLVFNTH